jgi:hypothetical protein
VFERERERENRPVTNVAGIASALTPIFEVPVSNHVSVTVCVENLLDFSNPYHGARIVWYLAVGSP